MASKLSPITIALRGGLNLAAADIDMKPGECRELVNYEIDTAGRYKRCTGFERYDGKPAPSAVRISELTGFPFATDEEALAALEVEIENRRAAISEVPGEGKITGIFVFNGITYAMRDNVGQTAAFLYKAVGMGWEPVTTPALNPGGSLVVKQGNFTGGASAIEIIGVDGANPAFRFDGTTYTQITTSIAPNTPIQLEILPSMVLLLGFRGGSFLFSGVGDPTKFEAVDGGGEFAIADEITEMQVQADSTCTIACRNRIYTLYGTSKVDFQLKRLPTKVGMIKGTAQNITDTVFLDDRGITTLQRVQQFGDFEQSTISQRIQPLLEQYAGRSACSVSIKSKNQYRLFFSDGMAVLLTFLLDGSYAFSQVYYDTAFSCAFAGEDLSGNEIVFVGSNSGYVYQLDRGNSFDGAEYTDNLLTGFMSMGSPELKKKWHKLVVECDSVSEVLLSAQALFDFMDPDIPDDSLLIGSGSKWDLSEWDVGMWGTNSTSWADMYISGLSRNIAIALNSTSKTMPPHIVSNLIIHARSVSRRR